MHKAHSHAQAQFKAQEEAGPSKASPTSSWTAKEKRKKKKKEVKHSHSNSEGLPADTVRCRRLHMPAAPAGTPTIILSRGRETLWSSSHCTWRSSRRLTPHALIEHRSSSALPTRRFSWTVGSYLKRSTAEPGQAFGLAGNNR